MVKRLDKGAKIGAGQSSYHDGEDFVQEAQEALWMVKDGTDKGQGQRKRR